MNPSLLAAVLSGCSGGPSPAPVDPAPAERPPARAGLPDVVLITLDTTRADRLGAYGYAKAKTPVLDGLAARGRRYDRAFSPTPLTIPAHATLFTGQIPPTHGVRSNGGAVLPPTAETLAEAFHAAGYDTAAAVGAYVTTRRWGFDQGFDHYADAFDADVQIWQTERPANLVVDDLRSWVGAQSGDRPRFVWAHLYDPHFPYEPPAGWLEKTEGRPYDAELAWVDSEVGRLLAAFEGRPTLVAVVADHGEGLGDHGEATHGMFVYDSTQRIPWILSGPGVEPGVVPDVVSLADVGPTLLDLLELPPLSAAEGRPVPETPERPVYMESWVLTTRFGLAPHIGVVVGDRKLIDLPRPEIYVASDPGELTNVADPAAAPGQAGHIPSLKDALAAFQISPPTAGGEEDLSVVDALGALGYVSGAMPTDRAALPDPKDHAEMLRKAQLVHHALRLGQHADADALLASLIAENPTVVEFKSQRVRALAALGRDEEALVLARELRQLDPASVSYKHLEATTLARLGRFREASTLLADVARDMPDTPRIRAAWFVAMLRSGDVNDAMNIGLRELQAHPDDHALAGELGLAFVKLGDFARAGPLLEQGALADRPERNVCFQLAAVATGRRDRAGALALLEREVALWPDNVPARIELLRTLGADAANAERLLALATETVAIAPKAVEAHAWRAQALFNLKRHDDARAAVKEGQALDALEPRLLLLEANLLAAAGDREAGAVKAEQAKVEAARRAAAAPTKDAPPAPTKDAPPSP